MVDHDLVQGELKRATQENIALQAIAEQFPTVTISAERLCRICRRRDKLPDKSY